MKQRFPSKIVPPVFENVFFRKRLFDLINNSKPLIWIDGPPGSGKTVLVADTIRRNECPLLWYRVTAGDKNISDFFYFLGLAAQRAFPEKIFDFPILTADFGDDLETYARIFFRYLFSEIDEKTVLVFDNCHELELTIEFSDLLRTALSEMPEDIQVFCVSRTKPFQNLTRLHVEGDLLVVDATKLVFSDEESKEFLHWLNPTLDPIAFSTLIEKTMGWAAGMVILAKEKSIHNSSLTPNAQEYQQLFDYLSSEIIAYIPDSSIDFLHKTAVFSQFTADMACQLTGYSNAKYLLNELVDKHFLIERSADEVVNYNYHPLFKEYLLSNVTDLLIKNELHVQAAQILEDQERFDEAISLYLIIEEWTECIRLILAHANQYIDQGRYRLLNQWIIALPSFYIEKDPWLNYWYAATIKPFDPMAAAIRLNESYILFLENRDVIGLYSTWQMAVESICIAFDDFTPLNIWFQRFSLIRKQFSPCPSIELKVRFYATAVQALTFLNPGHQWLKRLTRITEIGFRLVPIKFPQILLCSFLGCNYSFTGEILKLQNISTYLEYSMENNKLHILMRIFNGFLLGFFYQHLGKGERALFFLKKSEALMEHSGIKIYCGMINAHIVSSHICLGQYKQARIALQKPRMAINLKQRMMVALYHSMEAWLLAINGELTSALEHNELALQINRAINAEIGYVCSLALKAQFLGELNQPLQANHEYMNLCHISTKSGNKFYLIQTYLTGAWLAFLSNDTERIHASVRRLLRLLSSEHIVFSFGWRPDMIKSINFFAIEEDIETSFAVQMLKVNNLVTTPPLDLEQWPWPVRIYCFQEFRIELNDQLLQHSGKSQKKILELLLAIIVSGGRHVNRDHLEELLWPDSEGDMAHQALDTSLHRLRKLIGKETILLNSGKISLNTNYCWLDIWAFEATADQIRIGLKNNTDIDKIKKLSSRLIKLYQNPLCYEAEYSWAKPKHDQLQNMFTHLCQDLEHFFSKQGLSFPDCIVPVNQFNEIDQPK